MFNRILTKIAERGGSLLAFASGREKHLAVVLVHLPRNVVTPYVTWVWNDSVEGFFHGHYTSDQHEAIRDFADRMDSEMYVGEEVAA